MSSYDEYAIEAALRLKETFGGEVVAVAAGPASVRDASPARWRWAPIAGMHLELADVNATDTLGHGAICSPMRCDRWSAPGHRRADLRRL